MSPQPGESCACSQNQWRSEPESLYNIKELDLSLKASVIQKLYLNPKCFFSKLVRMSHSMFKNGLFPFISITTDHFRLFENE